MKAIILAAGYATRLYPLTLDQPKPLLEIGGKPMVEHIIAKLEKIPDLDEIHIVTNNKFYTHFLEWQNNIQSSKKIIIHNDGTLSNEDRLGSVGDIHFTIKSANMDDDVFVIAGDNLFEADLNKIVTEFKEHQKTIVAAKDLKDKSLLANKFGVIVTGENNRVIDFEEKPAEPKTALAATCIYLLNRTSVQELRELYARGEKIDDGGNFIKYLSDRSEVRCHAFDSDWYDIGSHEQLEEVRRYYGQR